MPKKNPDENQKNKNSVKKDGKSLESFDEKSFKDQSKSERDCTEWAESKLKESQKKLQLLIDSMPAVIGYINTDYRFQFANKFLKTLLNVDPSDIIGKHIKDVAGEKAFVKVKPKYDQAFAGVRQEFEMVVPMLNDRATPIHATYVPHKVKGKVKGVFILIQDITKRKKDEKELEEAKIALEKANLELAEALEIGVNQFNLFADNFPGNVFVKDDKLEYIFLNKNYLKTLNLNKRPKKNLTVYELYQDSVADKFHEIDIEVQETNQIIEKEIKTSDENEIEKWDRIIKFPIQMPDGKIFIGGIALDISQEKQKSQAIINSELRYRSLFDNARDGIFIIDSDKIIDVNRSSIIQFGCRDKSEMINKSVMDFSPECQPDGSLSKDSALKVINKALKGEPQSFNWVHKRKDGTEFLAEISLNQIHYKERTYLSGSIRDITEKVAVQQELLKAKEKAETSEIYLNNIINNIGDPVYVKDNKSRLLLVNDAFCTIFGLSREQIIGKTLAEDVPADEQENVFKIDKQVLETGEESMIEEKLTIKDREPQTIYTRKTRFIDNSGKNHLIGVIRDITERKKAEVALKSSEKKFRNLAESAQVSIAIFGGTSGKGYLYVNPYWEDLTGYSSKEARDLSVLDIVAPEFHAIVTERGSKRLEGEKVPDNYEIKLNTKSGKAKWVNITVIVTEFEGEKAILSTAVDITEKKLWEEALKENEKKLKAILDHHFQLTGLLDIEGKLLTVNQTALNLVGITKEKAIGKSFWDTPWWDSSQKEMLKSAIESAAKGQFIRFETTHTNSLGEIVNIDFSLNPVFDDNGNVIYIVPEGRDITERKLAEETLKESEEKYRSLFEQSMVGIGMAKGNEVMYVNEGMLKMWKYDNLEDFKKIPVIDHYAPDYRETIINRIKESSANRGKNLPRQYQFDILCKDGEIKTVIGHTNYIQISEEIYAQMVVIDVTDRIKAEEKTKETLMQLNLAVDTAKIGVWSHIIATDEVEWNNELFEIFGISPTEFDYSVEAFKKMVHPEDLELVMEQHGMAFQNKSVAGFNYRIIRPNKEVRYIYASVTPIFDKENNLLKITGINIDATEDKKAEEKLEQANLELIDAVSSLNELKKQLEDQNIYLKKELDLVFNFEEMVYGSAVFSNVLTDLEKVAPTDATVLILGESGTGKELLARALHNLSLRKDKPFIKVNCSAIPTELIESELFGHKKGSFTGAVSDKIGKFELANGGTLFLDEIGDLPLAMQPKLLRFLQEGEMEVVGSAKTKSLDVRIVAATNKDLEVEVKKEQFRKDLFFRLNVFPIDVPALRNRKEDVPLLVEHFVNKFGKKYRKNIKFINESAMHNLKTYNWPGNVRELENLIERSVILSDSETLRLHGFDSDKSEISIPISNTELTLTDVMRNHFVSVLEKTNWKIDGPNGAAQILDIKPSTFRDKMKKLGIKRPN